MLSTLLFWCSSNLRQQIVTFEPLHGKFNDLSFAPCEDSDQPGHCVLTGELVNGEDSDLNRLIFTGHKAQIVGFVMQQIML